MLTKKNISSKNQTAQFERFMAIRVCIQVVIFGQISLLKMYYSSVSEFPAAYKQYLTIKSVKRKCGLTVILLDPEKRKQMLSKLNLICNSVESSALFENYLEPAGVSINLKTNRGFKNFLKKMKLTLKKKSIADSEFCNFSFGECKCSDVGKGTNSEVLNAIKENMISNAEILKYINKNPVKEEVKKFGTPQSLFRNGTYGLHGMEINTWCR